LLLSFSSFSKGQDFIRIENTQFKKGNQTYRYLGTNFWYGMNLGASDSTGNRIRLINELDHLSALGVKNLRIMAATEGPNSEPWRISPALQTSPQQYSQPLLDGLDFLLAEMQKRDMHAVVCLNNMWPWSGGFAQYVNWVTKEKIPYPPPSPNGSWLKFTTYADRFFQLPEAQELANQCLELIINRTNSINNIPYKEDPTIMAWQLANEPRSLFHKKKYLEWVQATAKLIKSLDSNHLVSVGSEGNAFFPLSSKFKEEHTFAEIDYCTAHIWIENWKWYNPQKGKRNFNKAVRKAENYLKQHIAEAKELGKPIVLEEFGIARDNGSYSDASSTDRRDSYYDRLFTIIYQSDHLHAMGANFWAWGGEGRPTAPKAVWQLGNDFIGDPPFEYQGWYSVYNTDHSTLEVLKKWANIAESDRKRK